MHLGANFPSRIHKLNYILIIAFETSPKWNDVSSYKVIVIVKFSLLLISINKERVIYPVAWIFKLAEGLLKNKLLHSYELNFLKEAKLLNLLIDPKELENSLEMLSKNRIDEANIDHLMRNMLKKGVDWTLTALYVF